MQEQQQQQLDENQQRVRQQAEPGASGDAAVASGSNCSGRGGASMERVQYVMPVHASWFTLGGIHPHERNAVPEMSSGSQPGLNIEVGTEADHEAGPDTLMGSNAKCWQLDGQA